MGVVKKFTLPQERVTIKYIKKRTGMAAHVEDNHVISGGMLEDSKKNYTVPMLRSGALANVLTDAEKEGLEGILTGVNLSIYSDFWKDYYVTLGKNDNYLDLSDPYEYISYKILLALKNHVAPNWASRKVKSTYEFVIVAEGAEFKENKKGLDAKKDAFKLYGKIEDDKDQLIGLLKLLTNKPISKGSKLEWIQGQVEEIIDKSPSKFVALVKDSSLGTKLLINEGVELGVINKESNKYITADGLPLGGIDEIPTFTNAVKYLDAPKNAEIRDLIEAKINNAR